LQGDGSKKKKAWPTWSQDGEVTSVLFAHGKKGRKRPRARERLPGGNKEKLKLASINSLALFGTGGRGGKKEKLSAGGGGEAGKKGAPLTSP